MYKAILRFDFSKDVLRKKEERVKNATDQELLKSLDRLNKVVAEASFNIQLIGEELKRRGIANSEEAESKTSVRIVHES